MARSNKPLLWLPFAAGGLVAALIIPVLILLTGLLVPLGLVQLPYDKVLVLAHNPIGKLILFGTIALSVWHAAHRLRMTAHDLGLGGGPVVKTICYGAAGVLIFASAAALLALPPS
jgi:fumarate reductase subunit D